MVTAEVIAKQRRRGLELVAGRLEALRDKAGWTQRDVADLVKVTERQVRRWENGEQNIPATTWTSLCASAGVDAFGGDWRERPT